MKKGFCVLVAVFAVSALGANRLITEPQSYVMGALEKLKFKNVPSDVIGGPQKFKVTSETIKLLQKLQKEGQTVTVTSKGQLLIADEEEDDDDDK